MKFYIKQKVFSLKDKFNITDEHQNLMYQVKGKFMSITNKLELLDKDGNVLLRSHRKVLTFMPKYYIFDEKGQEVADIKRIFGFKPRFDLSILRRQMRVEGGLFAHAFTISDDRQILASINKKIISWGDTYEIDIMDEENKELFLFVVIVLDQVIHERRHR